MADAIKDYTGKIVRVHYLAGGQESSKTGIVFNQVNKGENMDVTMFLTNGTTWQPPFKAQITKVTLTHVQEVEKYASPERYSFLYRRYDGSITFTSEDNGLKRFCERNAPSVIPSLKPFAKIDFDANVGDKDFLTVSRAYTIALPYGCTKESLQYLKDILDGKVKAPADKGTKKKSLAEQIHNADGKRKSSAGLNKIKEQER